MKEHIVMNNLQVTFKVSGVMYINPYRLLLSQHRWRFAELSTLKNLFVTYTQKYLMSSQYIMITFFYFRYGTFDFQDMQGRGDFRTYAVTASTIKDGGLCHGVLTTQFGYGIGLLILGYILTKLVLCNFDTPHSVHLTCTILFNVLLSQHHLRKRLQYFCICPNVAPLKCPSV